MPLLSLSHSYWSKPHMLKSAAFPRPHRRHSPICGLLQSSPAPAMVKVFRPRSAFVKHLDPRLAVRVMNCHEQLEATREAPYGDELRTETLSGRDVDDDSDDDGMTSYSERIKEMNAEFDLYMLELDIARRMHELHLEQLRKRMTRQPAYPLVDPEKDATMKLYGQAVSAAQPQISM